MCCEMYFVPGLDVSTCGLGWTCHAAANDSYTCFFILFSLRRIIPWGIMKRPVRSLLIFFILGEL